MSLVKLATSLFQKQFGVNQTSVWVDAVVSRHVVSHAFLDNVKFL
jgi:hypothetical protein